MSHDSLQTFSDENLQAFPSHNVIHQRQETN